MYKKSVIILILFFATALGAKAQYQQKTSFRDGISITPLIGITAFHGDFNLEDNQGRAFGIAIDKEIKEKFGIKLKIDNGNLRGIYIEDGSRIFEATADFFQFGLGGYLNLSNMLGGYNRYRRLFINVGFGGGLINFNEWNRYLEGSENIQYGDNSTGETWEQTPFTENLHYIDEHGRGNSPFVDGGLMIDYKLTRSWYVKVDANINYLFTSRIDGVEHYYFNGTNYYDPNANPNTPFKPLDATGPVDTPNDYFYSVMIGIKYRLSYKKRINNTGMAKPSNRKKFHRLPSNQFFENLYTPGSNVPKLIK